MEPLRALTAVSGTATNGALSCWTFSTLPSASPFSWPSRSRHVSPSGCEGGAMFDLILGLAVAAGLFVYLGAALLRPDRF
ncbi:K(+)-transporting ATPase subunit F [Methylobrevis albus]|nr:K(+)-transporting ATPase subunit F [Methylobrevis albus]